MTVPRKQTKKPLGVLKRKLDIAFAAMILNRDKGKMCISCGKVPGTQAGHFMRRGHQATRWHPMNVHGQCFRCNHVESGNQLEYADRLDLLFGPGTSSNLRNLARMPWKPARERLEALLAATSDYEEYWRVWFNVD